MKVKRNDKICNVIEYLHESQEVCVEDVFKFANKPYYRTLKLWWDLEDCEIIDEQNGTNDVQTGENIC